MTIFVLGIGGTTRPNSSTEKALRASLASADRAGAETMMFGARDLLLPMYDPKSTKRTPEAKRLVDALRRSNGVIIASPGYHGTMSGLVKNALDYVEDLRNHDPPYLAGRAVGCISAALGWQATVSTLTSLRMVVHALRGWPTPIGASINTGEEVFDADGVCIDAQARFQLELVAQQVVEFARLRAAESLQ
jgi:FMN reductase